jgi:hypothetical protein
MKKKDYGILEILGILTMLIILLVVSPWISFWCAYFSGWLAKITIGGTLCKALNILFETTRFSPNMLPMMAGALGWIGAFFKGTIKIKEK